eukprot:11195505-Lingulodinium_polyedra.AAC.1
MIGESDADTDADDSEDSGREVVGVSAVASLPDVQQVERIYWAYGSAKRVWRRTAREGYRECPKARQAFRQAW